MAGKAITDISFAGAKITVAGVQIEDFADDANPIEFQNTEVSGVGVNLNGNMIRYAKPNVIIASVTVLPNSGSEAALRALMKKYRVQAGNNAHGQWETPLDLKITTQTGQSWHFSNGTFVSGPGGPGSSADGKMQGRTYTFAFVTMD